MGEMGRDKSIVTENDHTHCNTSRIQNTLCESDQEKFLFCEQMCSLDIKTYLFIGPKCVSRHVERKD